MSPGYQSTVASPSSYSKILKQSSAHVAVSTALIPLGVCFPRGFEKQASRYGEPQVTPRGVRRICAQETGRVLSERSYAFIV